MTVIETETQKITNAHPFIEYVEFIVTTQPKLYANRLLALLTYRFLPQLAQVIVDKLLYFKGPIPFMEVRNWFRPELKAVQNKVLWRLKQLQILQGKGQEVWVNREFQASLLQSFSLKRPESVVGVSTSSITELDIYAKKKWELILYELVKNNSKMDVQTSSASGAPAKRTKTEAVPLLQQLLDGANLLSRGNVSNLGFQFLLKDVSAQIWHLLIHYFKYGCGNDLRVLEFVAEQVLYGQPGVPLKLEHLGLQPSTVELFEQFGLLFPNSTQKRDYCSTRLLTSLSGRKNALDFTDVSTGSGGNNAGFLAVETNFRIYAYTSSALQIAILALFIRLTDRFPNLVYGQLTRESIQGALANGISADQIIHFLQINAHPCMKTVEAGNVLPFNGIPFTVIDQIRLWELDRNRLAHRPGYLYQQFLNDQQYEAALEEAKTIGAVLYAKPATRTLIISEEGHEHMKQFVKSLKV